MTIIVNFCEFANYYYCNELDKQLIMRYCVVFQCILRTYQFHNIHLYCVHNMLGVKVKWLICML